MMSHRPQEMAQCKSSNAVIHCPFHLTVFLPLEYGDNASQAGIVAQVLNAGLDVKPGAS